MTSRRQTQVAEAIAHLAGAFLARESSVKALLTATHADVSPDLRGVIVYLSVLPHTLEEAALTFAKRARSDFREYLKKHSFLNPVPIVDFAIDLGEKNRQRIDELTRKEK